MFLLLTRRQVCLLDRFHINSCMLTPHCASFLEGLVSNLQRLVSLCSCAPIAKGTGLPSVITPILDSQKPSFSFD